MSLILQQTKSDPKLNDALRQYAKDHGRFFQAVYTKAIADFIEEINKNHSSGARHLFCSSPRDGKNINMKIPEKLKDAALFMAKQEQTSARRLYYTALVRFALKEELFTKEDLK